MSQPDNRGRFLTDDELRRLADGYRLSPREAELLGLILGGVVDNAQLARAMGLTITSLKTLVHLLLVKTRCEEKTSLVLCCYQQILHWRVNQCLRDRLGHGSDTR